MPKMFPAPCGMLELGASSAITSLFSRNNKDGMNTKTVAALALVLVIAPLTLAGPFTVYPGATKMPDRGERANPNHAVMYSTPDSYAKVLDYYKKDGKVDRDHPMEGATVIAFDGGGIIVRDMGTRGTMIVVDHRTKQ
jgi:hypothetical protein